MNEDILVERMILEIESDFDKICDKYQEKYCNKLDGPAVIRYYFMCIQGFHNCDTFVQKLETMNHSTTPTGLVWLCRGCKIKNDMSLPKAPRPSLSSPLAAQISAVTQ